MIRLNAQAVQSIMVYLLRSPSFMRMASSKLQPDHFYDEGHERVYKRIYEIARNYFNEHHELPTKDIILSDLYEFVAKYKNYFNDDHLQFAVNLVFGAWSKEYDNADTKDHIYHYNRNKLAEFLAERGVTDKIQDMLSQGDMQVKQLIETMQKRVSESMLIDEDVGVSAMSSLSTGPVTKRTLTGAAWFDYLSDGGLYEQGGEIIGFFSGTGYGKTTASVHIATAMAKRGRDVFYFSYEQAVADAANNHKLLHKAISSATGIPTSRLECGLDALTEQEKELLKLEEAALKNHLRFFDMTGYQNQTGKGGIAEIETYLAMAAQQGRRVGLVIIDWFGELRGRRLAQEASKYKDARAVTSEEMKTALVLSVKYNTNFLIIEQSSTAAMQKKPNIKLDVTDVQEAKNLGHLMHMLIGMTQPSSESGFATMATVKARHTGRKELVVKYLWEQNQIIAKPDMHRDAKMKAFVRNGEEHQADSFDGDSQPVQRKPTAFLNS